VCGVCGAVDWERLQRRLSVADKTQIQLLERIASSFSLIEATPVYLEENQAQLIRIADTLETISERLSRLIDLNEHEAQALADLATRS
jgi:hypothetical protein